MAGLLQYEGSSPDQRRYAHARPAAGELDISDFQLLLKSLPDGAILVIDPQLHYRLAEGPLLAKLGLEPADLVGKSVWEAGHASDVETVVAHYRQALAGKTSTIEVNQEQCDYLSRAIPLHDRHGDVYSIAVFEHDITERRRLEKALRDSERMARHRLQALEAVYDQAPVGLCVVDTDLRYVRVNRRLADFNGCPPEEHIGRSIHDVIPGTAEELEPLLLEVIRRGEPLLDVEVTREIDGVKRISREQFYPLKNCKKQVTGINVVVEEITERREAERALRESEERFRLALQNVPLILCQCDLDLRYTWLSQGFASWPAKRIIGRLDDEFLPSEVAAPILAFKRRVLERGVQERTEFRVPMAFGMFTFDVTAEPLRDQNGDVVGLTMIGLEISERKQAEAEREQLLQELAEERQRLQALTETLEERVRERTEQVRALASELMLAEQRERQRIAQMLHDDVQQMLYSVQMSLHLMRSRVDATIERELDQVAAYIDDVIEGTRTLTMTLTSPAQERVRLEEILTALAAAMQDYYNLDVEVEVEAGIHLQSEEMRELVAQLARELLFNVVKHAGVRRAQLRACVSDQRLVVEVSDKGVGFNAARPQQAQKGGFGLYSIHQRVSLYGGDVTIFSVPQGGTRVTIRLPYEQPAPPQQTPAAPVTMES